MQDIVRYATNCGATYILERLDSTCERDGTIHDDFSISLCAVLFVPGREPASVIRECLVNIIAAEEGFGDLEWVSLGNQVRPTLRSHVEFDLVSPKLYAGAIDGVVGTWPGYVVDRPPPTTGSDLKHVLP